MHYLFGKVHKEKASAYHSMHWQLMHPLRASRFESETRGMQEIDQ